MLGDQVRDNILKGISYIGAKFVEIDGIVREPLTVLALTDGVGEHVRTLEPGKRIQGLHWITAKGNAAYVAWQEDGGEQWFLAYGLPMQDLLKAIGLPTFEVTRD